MTPEKSLTRVNAVHADTITTIDAYEIHIGRTRGRDCRRPFARIDGKREGAVSADGRVHGSYLHGLFASDAFRAAFLARLGMEPSEQRYRDRVESTLEALAEHIEKHVDVDGLLALAR